MDARTVAARVSYGADDGTKDVLRQVDASDTDVADIDFDLLGEDEFAAVGIGDVDLLLLAG